jgi:GNAT superfamily N-acetyltransferase
MKAGVEICLARPEDATDIAEIHMVARAAAMPWLAVVHTPGEVRHHFETAVLPGTDVRVARTDGVISGFIALRGDWIDHLYLAPGAWRQGLGRLLLQEAMATRRELQLWVFQRNDRARRFYESFGFMAVEFTDGSANEEREPDVRYVWMRSGELA